MHDASAILLPGLASSNGLTFVVLGTVAFSLVMSVLFLFTRDSGSMYDQIGQGGISREEGSEDDHPVPASARAEQEQEVRQMLTARSERLVRAGKPPLDVEAEVRRLLSPGLGAEAGHDPQLVAEVRQLVQARNERRARAGEEPLDVEAEVARTLEELGG